MTESPPRPSPLPADFDLAAFTADVDALAAELERERGPEDLRHLRRIERWGRACTLAGWAMAWQPWLVPVAALLIAQGRFTRWAMVAHHVMHRGYDRVPGAPETRTSKGFARGWRRLIDWMDWMVPAAWDVEHNRLHHYRLGEAHDPDVVELNSALVADPRLPRWLRALMILGIAMTWKPLYYAASTMRELVAEADGTLMDERPQSERIDPALLLPWHRVGRRVWLECWLPFVAWHFVLLPAPFALISTDAWLGALVTSLLAEVATNLHSFAVIVTNHSGGDLWRFEGRPKGKGVFYLRQILGSTNFTTGGDARDFLHGWLGYQIEHHVFPTMSMRQYQLAQPRLEAICARHGVPYVAEPIPARVRALVRLMLGDERMPISDEPWLRSEGATIDEVARRDAPLAA
jgi:fatty acid desaturase